MPMTEKSQAKNAANYVKSQQWGCFKNTKRKLLFASLWVKGIREKLQILADISANEDVDVYSMGGTVLRAFNMNQPQLPSEVVSNLLEDPNAIVEYINQDYSLLEEAESVISRIKEAIKLLDFEQLRANTLLFIDLHAEIGAYEYFINGLAQGLFADIDQYRNIGRVVDRINMWRNDEAFDRQSSILKEVVRLFIDSRKLEFSADSVVNYVHIDEFIDFLNDNKHDAEIAEIIRRRKKYGYTLLNLREKKFQNSIWMPRRDRRWRRLKVIYYQYINTWPVRI